MLRRWFTPVIPALWDYTLAAEAQPVWFTELVLGHPGLHKETPSGKRERERRTERNREREQMTHDYIPCPSHFFLAVLFYRHLTNYISFSPSISIFLFVYSLLLWKFYFYRVANKIQGTKNSKR